MNAYALVEDGLELSAERSGRDTLVLRLRGELDLSTTPGFQDWADQATLGDAERVIVDLSEVEFIDSAGITSLVRLRQRLAPGAAVHLAGPGRHCLEALHVAQIMRLMPVHRSVEAALRETAGAALAAR
jgi:anti-sigma B factor antagonist